MAPEANGKNRSTHVDIPEHGVKNLTVEEMYDKEKYDFYTRKLANLFILNFRKFGEVPQEIIKAGPFNFL